MESAEELSDECMREAAARMAEALDAARIAMQQEIIARLAQERDQTVHAPSWDEVIQIVEGVAPVRGSFKWDHM